jgi:fructokinase
MQNNIRCRIGIDLGGTKIEGVAIGFDGTEIIRHRIDTPVAGTSDRYDRIVYSIDELVRYIESAIGMSGTVGVGIPGTLSVSTGKIKNANTTELIGRPFDKDLEKAIGRPIRLANDANCFALSEAVDGAGKGSASVFGVIIGTGTGGGIVVDGKVVAGLNGIGGEWGHNPLPWPKTTEMPGPDCYCGLNGCIETYLSGPGLKASYQRLTGDVSEPVEIIELFELGNSKARTVIEDYVDRLARGLASIINVLDPEVIVLGGGLSNIDYLYESVPKQWMSYVFSDDCYTRLRKAVHGDSGGVRGAAWLWSDK